GKKSRIGLGSSAASSCSVSEDEDSDSVISEFSNDISLPAVDKKCTLKAIK
ncbi:hypothetical protein SARC_14693, partial [Sphaeroforma arctica JP610]